MKFSSHLQISQKNNSNKMFYGTFDDIFCVYQGVFQNKRGINYQDISFSNTCSQL